MPGKSPAPIARSDFEHQYRSEQHLQQYRSEQRPHDGQKPLIYQP
jgi:hypothetical protein